MQTKDLLNLIYEKIEECHKHKDYVTQVLHKYTLRKLHDILVKISNNGKRELSTLQDFTQLREFLANFYGIVKNTNALPLHTPNSDLSKIMLHLAEKLESFLHDSNRFKLLMPSLQVSDYVISGTSLNNPQLKLTDFVMSDDNQCLIEVLSCLSFASEDGVLKHCCLFNGETKILSPSEAQRVINHSQETKEYWDAIQDKLQITKHGNSFGAILEKLADDLFSGSVHAKNGGSEDNSGAKANIGIVNFFLWYGNLSQEEKTYLQAQQSELYNLENILSRLNRPRDQKHTETALCVYIISQNIRHILKNNPTLYNKFPENAEAVSTSIELAQAAVNNAEARLAQALAKPNYQVTATYGNETQHALLMTNLLNLPDLDTYVSKNTIEKMRRQKHPADATPTPRNQSQYRGRQYRRPRII